MVSLVNNETENIYFYFHNEVLKMNDHWVDWNDVTEVDHNFPVFFTKSMICPIDGLILLTVKKINDWSVYFVQIHLLNRKICELQAALYYSVGQRWELKCHYFLACTSSWLHSSQVWIIFRKNTEAIFFSISSTSSSTYWSKRLMSPAQNRDWREKAWIC